MNKVLEELPDGSAVVEISTVPAHDLLVLVERGKSLKPGLFAEMPGCTHRHRTPLAAFTCGVRLLSSGTFAGVR